ncbi:MAG: hypothetical protein ACI9RG_000688 [Sulfurimonas sp.]|jgi:hypothetical protein
MVIDTIEAEIYLFDKDKLVCYRTNWNASINYFPKDVPIDIPDIIFQMESGLYGVRDKSGKFDEDRYKKLCFLLK